MKVLSFILLTAVAKLTAGTLDPNVVSSLPSQYSSSSQQLATPRPQPSAAQGWQEVQIEGIPIITPKSRDLQTTADAMVRGNSLLLLDDIVTESECTAVVAACSSAAARNRQDWVDAGYDAPCTVRLPSAAAVKRELWRPESADEAQGRGLWPGPVPTEADDVCTEMLRRVLIYLDAEWPTLIHELFEKHGTSNFSKGLTNQDRSAKRSNHRSPRSLMSLFENGALVWANREPSVNVYAAGGDFSAHQDEHAITVLIPLTPPEACTGGGTGFWGSRHGTEPPVKVLKPKVGSALIFGGQVIHAGVAVLSGERAVFVASFSARNENRPLAWFSD